MRSQLAANSGRQAKEVRRSIYDVSCVKQRKVDKEQRKTKKQRQQRIINNKETTKQRNEHPEEKDNPTKYKQRT